MKRYLTGIDWIINSLDCLGKAQSGVGNVSQVIMELRGDLDKRILQKALSSFIQKFPFLNGTRSRGLNLCPYWKIYPRKKMLPLRLKTTYLEDHADTLEHLAAQVNEPFRDKREHLVFNLVHTSKKTLLSMTFDHRVLDARGAEAFLDLFQRYWRQAMLPEISFTEPPHLDHWQEKFRAGRQVNRVFLSLSRETPRTFPTASRSGLCKFKVINFDRGRTACCIDDAYDKAGYLMLMPYTLAKSVQIMHRSFEARNVPGSTYLIPVSIDTRKREAEDRELFFNQLSFLFFKIEARIADSFSLLLTNIKEQMYEQVKTGLPEAIKRASFLLRIAPLPLTNFFLQCMSKKHFASFAFSFVGGAYNAKKLIGHEVQNIFHLPRVPNPPGVGIFFNQFQDKINATLSYYEGLLTDQEVERIVGDLDGLGNNG